MQLRKTNYKAIFLRAEGDRYVVIGSKYFKADTEKLEYKDKSFLITLKNLLYRDKNKSYLFIEYEKGNILSFNKLKYAIDADDIDLIVSKNIIAQMLMKLNPIMNKQGLLIFIIVGIAFGAVGYIYGMQQAPVREVIKYVNGTMPIA
jgi:hypothetical protein